MDQKTTIFIIVAVGVIIIVLLFVKNWKDRKKLYPPKGADPVEEQKMESENQRDKL